MTFEDAIRNLTKAQRAALDRFALGQPAGCSQHTVQALVARGLLAERTRLDGAFRWREYDVPLAVHMAWCNVGAEEFDALSPKEQAAMDAPDEA